MSHCGFPSPTTHVRQLLQIYGTVCPAGEEGQGKKKQNRRYPSLVGQVPHIILPHTSFSLYCPVCFTMLPSIK